MSQGIKVLFGTASFGANPIEKNEEYLGLLDKYQVKHLDTAAIYVGILAYLVESTICTLPDNTYRKVVSELWRYWERL